jgi:ATP-dependent DNA ligase
MSLPLATSLPLVEECIAREIPIGPEWQYEPKWEGHRCRVFRDGDRIQIESGSEQEFPSLVNAIKLLKPKKFVADGSIVIDESGTPALLLSDLLVDERGRCLTSKILAERRARLEQFGRECLNSDVIRLSPATPDPEVAQQWLSTMHLDGIIAKRRDLP